MTPEEIEIDQFIIALGGNPNVILPIAECQADAAIEDARLDAFVESLQ